MRPGCSCQPRCCRRWQQLLFPFFASVGPPRQKNATRWHTAHLPPDRQACIVPGIPCCDAPWDTQRYGTLPDIVAIPVGKRTAPAAGLCAIFVPTLLYCLWNAPHTAKTSGKPFPLQGRLGRRGQDKAGKARFRLIRIEAQTGERPTAPVEKNEIPSLDL